MDGCLQCLHPYGREKKKFAFQAAPYFSPEFEKKKQSEQDSCTNALTLCSHRVPEHRRLGTGTKQCSVQTLGIASTQVPFSAPVQDGDLGC